eukprot:COSAG01_NODE_714_length_14097_cov_6.044435_5_plen_112_part_00
MYIDSRDSMVGRINVKAPVRRSSSGHSQATRDDAASVLVHRSPQTEGGTGREKGALSAMEGLDWGAAGTDAPLTLGADNFGMGESLPQPQPPQPEQGGRRQQQQQQQQQRP